MVEAAKRRVGYVWDTLYGWVDTGTGGMEAADPARGLQPISHHVAHADTKRRFHELVQVSALREHLTPLQARYASEDELARVHTREHIAEMKRQSQLLRGGDAGDDASPFGRGGFDIARLAAGGAIRTVEAVVTGEVDTAYGLVNPPGHHAERARGMGFCLFGNASVAIAHAREVHGVRRVAVVDWDVHHGNGTQDIWWDNPEVLTISIHQHNSFPPRSGHREHNGTGAGKGAALNIPLPPGSGNAVYDLAFADVVVPALERFNPELIVVASGFDAAVMDPLAQMMVTQRGFKALTRRLLAAADALCGGRIAFLQEGGYSPYYLPVCGLGVIEELTGRESGFGDPHAANLDTKGVDDLYDHQRAEVARAAALVEQVPAG
ncbi:class II histone deacetylase [Corynebacterium sp. 32222D000AT]